MSNEAKLGLFVLIVGGVFFLFTINMGTILISPYDNIYYIHFEHVGNLERGSPVRQAGVQVGEVKVHNEFETVREEDGRLKTYVKVTIVVSDNARIAEDSVASIVTKGMMGEQSIEISFGGEELAKPGAVIQGQAPWEIDRVMAAAISLTDEVRHTVTSLNKILGEEELHQDIISLIANLEGLTRNLGELVGDDEEPRLKTIMDNAALASANLRNMMATAELTIGGIHGLVEDSRDDLVKTLRNTSEITDSLKRAMVEDIDVIASDLRRFTSRLDSSMAQVEGIIASASNVLEESRPTLSRISENITDISENVKRGTGRVDEMLDAIQNRPGLLHSVIYDEQMAVAAKSTITDVSGVLRGLSELPERFSYEAELKFFADKRRFDSRDDHVRADLGIRYEFTDYLHFFLGGSNLGATNTLDALFGYTYGPITLRGGVIESEVGAGIHWQATDRWMLGLQGLGFTESGKERMDVFTEYMIWNPILLTGGVQDVTDDIFPWGGFKVRF